MRLFQIAMSGWLASALATAARLDLAEHLAGEPMSAAELAGVVGADSAALDVLLHVLVEMDVFAQDESGRFTNSPLSEQLRDGHPRSARHFCLLAVGSYGAAWQHLDHTVRTGKPAFPHRFGLPLYEYLEQNPDEAAVFDRSMANLTGLAAPELVAAHDFSAARRVVDLGGGNGHLLAAVLRANPHLDGICVDRAEVCARAGARLTDAGMADLVGRLHFQPADLLASVPAGGDVYLLKNVLHDCRPDTIVRMLTVVRTALVDTARAAAGSRPRLLIVEPLNGAAPNWVLMLTKMVMFEQGAQLHTEAEMRALVAQAGLRVLSAQRLPSIHTVLECGLPD
ncbi:O-methyltransferase [Goodfellowiella coeruleoviolacea]|uniref:O-methyltransferase n=2 Tax=Goodfellowiella coeruleoviolacea TaxID=334858 RepID=A0AAE3GFY7_9PSEU|nr:O-methyltransferase [Goodfellowiella coeruleoviolacea]